MSIGRVVYVGSMRLIQSILLFIRGICSRSTSNRRNNHSDVPFEVVVDSMQPQKREERESLLDNAGGGGDSWDNDDWHKKEEINEKIEQWRHSNVQKPSASAAQPEEDDLFSTLAPKITSARKVVVKPRGEVQTPAKQSMFEMKDDALAASSTLGEIDDNLVAWEDDLDMTLKQHETNQVEV